MRLHEMTQETADPTALMNSKYEDLMTKLKYLKDNTTSFINEIEQTQKS